MIEKRPFADLGRFENDWLKARHHFSFSSYQDPHRMNWGALRVWNDDTIAPKTGFPPHSHADMEIITYVRSGAITHTDGMGNEGRTEAGDVQVMSAGSGVTHAEYNLEDEPTQIFQIWIIPKMRGGPPFWGSASFPKSDRAGRLTPLASGFEADQAQGALPIRQDARVLAGTLMAGHETLLAIPPERRAYLTVAAGAVEVGGVRLDTRDGAAMESGFKGKVRALADAEIVIVDTV